MLFTIQIPHAI
nr:unnamed protein product [Callosobruchus chinensis]